VFKPRWDEAAVLTLRFPRRRSVAGFRKSTARSFPTIIIDFEQGGRFAIAVTVRLLSARPKLHEPTEETDERASQQNVQ
jgi:hypothetical protein